MKTIANDGSTGSLVLNQPKTDPRTSQVYLANDLSEAKLDVNVEVGPSSTSKRQATVRALTGMLQITQDPETMQVLTAMTMMNMEGEGISDVRQYFRKKLLAMGAVQPTEEEEKELAEQAQNQQPDPNAQYLEAAAEKQRADALKATAETELTSAKIGNTQADTIVKLAGVEQQRIDTAMAMAAQLNPQEAPVMSPANMQ